MTVSLPRLLHRAGPALWAVLALAAIDGGPSVAAAQEHGLASPAGDTLSFELAELRVMLEEARALFADLEEDPRVLYYLGFGPPVPAEAPHPAYPWNAVQPRSDSVVNLVMPGNLREADRAYHNYAVLRMREIRTEDPDDPCDALVAREERVLSGFVDGWILARTLFGGPPYAPLDELAFARSAGHLPALLASRGDEAVGACASAWAEAHPGAIEAYEAWRAEAFPALDVPPPDEVDVRPELPGDPDAVPPAPPPGEDGLPGGPGG